ncbi:ATP-binding protein [Anaerofustis stercorihominis]|uniref:ATP-binding protein n=1 Tax=Anaerofustis stercorihominis TaxID=214853 RepID=UPI00214CB79E|nr:ATP-binding protein [Anaerofustis stercorihominis]MCR2033083.1 ATP-binding protein [Anaerofustis stercorihominis]
MKHGKYSKVFNIIVPILLFLSFTCISITSLNSINNMQGNARVINYSGIVRGATQRLIKQEMHNNKNDELISKLDKILKGLSRGSEEFDLIILSDKTFQKDIANMQEKWEEIKKEIYLVRNGKDSNKLYSLSEEYFDLADEAVYAAEVYSENKVQNTVTELSLLSILFIIFVIVFLFFQKKQKKLSIELQVAENASKEKSNFLSRMSHEIRTPMNGIIGMTDIACMNYDNPEKTLDCLNKIKLSSEYLLSLINDILDMSRIENGKIELYKQTFDLCGFCERLYIMFSQRAQDASLDFNITSNITRPYLIGDELRLNQVVVNIVSNALKFTPANGRIDVDINQKIIDDEVCSLIITVKDSGIGMSKEFLSKIFEPFEQEVNMASHQFAGTGLGLAISHNLVKLMDGNINVSSEQGKGSKFEIIIELPIADKADYMKIHDSVHSMDNDNKNLIGYNILLAEDNEINAEIAMSLLEMKGASVKHVWNGKEAVDEFLHSGTIDYDVILMDVKMPEMDGLEACEYIRSSKHKNADTIPIIGLSANAFVQDIDKAKSIGMNDYVSKPFNVDELIYTIIKLNNKI